MDKACIRVVELNSTLSDREATATLRKRNRLTDALAVANKHVAATCRVWWMVAWWWSHCLTASHGPKLSVRKLKWFHVSPHRPITTAGRISPGATA